MLFLLAISGMVLSIIKANGWIVIPTYCVVLCWIMNFFSCIIYSYAKGIGEELAKKVKQEKKEEQ